MFTAADPGDAETLIRTWAVRYTRWDDAHERVTEREVHRRFQRATVIFELPDLRANAEHDWGYVVGCDGFHEYVCVDRGARELALIVASDD
ncbi:hypothetical protein [Mycolicibacterium arenosum]|uniref:Uncharacterized protein n=1 Tax=Mycolicibacterium arenosum TaxID=2952157 RepID=A0ABT1MF06_9MYCO|nr:hypothetical protein [Mycolicibacterium sp. CAU 1645]MCP9276794.1 hypothetical protein [Mycolicibacterium sp. CAU 1645]